jgi:hypothetical protein
MLSLLLARAGNSAIIDNVGFGSLADISGRNLFVAFPLKADVDRPSWTAAKGGHNERGRNLRRPLSIRLERIGFRNSRGSGRRVPCDIHGDKHGSMVGNNCDGSHHAVPGAILDRNHPPLESRWT